MVKLEQLRQQLSTLGPGMEKEAKAMTAALNTEIKKQTAAVKALSLEAQTAAGATKGMADAAQTAGVKMDKLGMAMGPIGGVLGKISPEAGAAATAVAGLTSGFQGLAAAGLKLQTAVPILLAVSAAVAAVSYAWQSANAELAKAEARSEKAAKGADQMTDYVLALEAAQAKLKGTVGTLTEQEEKLMVRREAALKLAKDSAGLSAQEAANLKMVSDKITEAKEQEIEYRYAAKESAEVLAKRAKAAAAAAAADATAKAEAAAAAAAQEEEAAKAAAREELARQQMFEHEERQREARWQTAREAVKARQMELDAAKAATKAAADAAKKAAEEEIAAARATAVAFGELFGATSNALNEYASEVAKENKKAARDAFNVGKVVAISSALVNTALAVTNALATVPYPAAPIAAAAAALSGGVQIASIAAQKPSFHAGGMLYPDEASARVLTGEPILNRQAAAQMGLDTPGAVGRINHDPGARPAPVSLRIGRLEAREIIRTDVMAGGLIVRTATAAASNAGAKAGRTGRRPIG
jgi:hypothetical protein